MSDVETTVERYFAMWNEPDAAARAAVIAQAWVEDATYVDPVLEAEGHEALSAMVARVQEMFPGHRLRPVGTVDAHHDQLRFGWELVGPDGSVAMAGLDVGAVSPDGRLARITGFLEDSVAA